MIAKKDEKILRKMLSLATEPDQALTYDEMRGFLFGVAITPDVLFPSEWLPMVFGEEMITIDSEKEGQRLLNTLMQVVNGLTERFQNETLRFPFKLEKLAHDEEMIAIQDWVFGLSKALSLRGHCWFESLPESVPEEVIGDYEEELFTGLSVIHAVADPDEADEFFDTQFEDAEDRSERLLALLFIMLPTAVEKLLEHAGLLEHERRERFIHGPESPRTTQHQSPKVGRNDPCPCGSGKKYKKCCMRKEKIVPIR
jgi:uncharacterized protein